MSEKTVLYDLHVFNEARLVDFHGWELPVQYEGVLAEHRHCREQAVVFDTSHMGQFRITGSDAERQLAQIGTQNALSLPEHKCRYGFLLNERGGVLDDTILMRLGADDFMLVVNAGTRARDYEWIASHLDGPVHIRDLTAQGWGKIDLQGPKSFDVLTSLVDFDLSRCGYFSVRRGRFSGRDCVISRTGYTGELGYEIMAPGEHIPYIFKRLLEDPTVRPAGLGARDSLRLEMGYPLYGQEMDESRNPVEAGMDRFLLSKQNYIGSEAVQAMKDKGPERILVPFRSDTRRRAETGDVLLDGEVAVGQVTSGGFSPSLERSIGMAYIQSDRAKPGTELTLQLKRAQIPVTVAEKPLYGKGTWGMDVTDG